jgi:hypothetical protein
MFMKVQEAYTTLSWMKRHIYHSETCLSTSSEPSHLVDQQTAYIKLEESGWVKVCRLK